MSTPDFSVIQLDCSALSDAVGAHISATNVANSAASALASAQATQATAAAALVAAQTKLVSDINAWVAAS